MSMIVFFKRSRIGVCDVRWNPIGEASLLGESGAFIPCQITQRHLPTGTVHSHVSEGELFIREVILGLILINFSHI